jgi:enterobactin synthetase component D
LIELGLPKLNVPIGKHRSPVWPNDVVASITHTKNIALCAAASKRDFACLGVDIENWLETSSTAELESILIFRGEKKILITCGMSFDKALVLTFSAKESLFKAIYSKVGYYFDFSAAEVVRIEPSKGLLELVLRDNLGINLTPGTRFKVNFDYNSNGVITILAQPTK